MSVSRRRFLQNSALAAAACAAAPLYAWNGNKPNLDGDVTRTFSPRSLNRQAFERLVGSAFKVSPASGKGSSVWVRLLEVQDLPALVPVNVAIMAVPPPKSTSPPVSTTGFMLTFGAPGVPLRQDTYSFEHDGLGKFALLIVPNGPGLDTYTAVINHLDSNPTVHLANPRTDVPTPRTDVPTGSGDTPTVAPGGSGRGRPPQEQVEPVFRDRLKPELPE